MMLSNTPAGLWHNSYAPGAVKIPREVAELETLRLTLKRFTANDFGELCCIFGRPEVTRFMGDGLPTSPLQTSIALESIIKHYEIHGFGRLAVREKATGRLIGYGGLRSLDGVPELVYLLDSPYWNRGLATEIGVECLRHGFEDHGFERIVAMTKLGNIFSQRVLAKLGMCCEGLSNYYNFDVLFYSMLRSASAHQNAPVVEP